MPLREKMRRPQELECELKRLVGTTHKGEWHTVNTTDVSAFVKATRNHQFIHNNVAGVRERSPYGEVIAPAYMTLSLLPHLTRRQICAHGFDVALLNYGFNKVRFTEGTPVGARIRAESTITKLEPREHGYLITRTIVIYSDRSTQPIGHIESLLYLTATH